MFGCMRRIVSLVVLALVVGAAWLTRDRWYPELFGTPPASPTGVAEGDWKPVTSSEAARGRKVLSGVSSSRAVGPVELTPAEAVGLVLDTLLRELPGARRDVEATIIGDRLYVRANVPLGELGGDMLGPLKGMVGANEPVLLGGTMDMIRPGLAQFRVAEVKVRDLALPTRLVPRLMRELRRGAPPAEGVADDAVAFRLPEGVQGVSIHDGQVVLRTQGRP